MNSDAATPPAAYDRPTASRSVSRCPQSSWAVQRDADPLPQYRGMFSAARTRAAWQSSRIMVQVLKSSPMCMRAASRAAPPCGRIALPSPGPRRAALVDGARRGLRPAGEHRCRMRCRVRRDDAAGVFVSQLSTSSSTQACSEPHQRSCPQRAGHARQSSQGPAQAARREGPARTGSEDHAPRPDDGGLRPRTGVKSPLGRLAITRRKQNNALSCE
jgi:hypothetical protein